MAGVEVVAPLIVLMLLFLFSTIALGVKLRSVLHRQLQPVNLQQEQEEGLVASAEDSALNQPFSTS
jgi:type II secretory pathway component PulK